MKLTAAQKAAHAKRIERYREWMLGRGITRFNFAAEVAALGNRVKLGVNNDTPPVELWDNIIVPLRVGERMRERFGACWFSSAFRSTLYNAAIYEGKQVIVSRHSFNDALDGAFATGTPRDWAAHLRELRGEGLFTGGIGVYSSWVHWDNRGTVANWNG